MSAPKLSKHCDRGQTAYIDKYDRLRYVTHPNLIAKRYLSSWFIVDFLSSFPFVHIVYLFVSLHDHFHSIPTEDHSALVMFEYLRLLRMLKLLRLIQIVKMFKMIQQHTFDHQTLSIISIAKIICIMLLTTHYFACFWYGIGVWSHSEGMTSWIEVIQEEHGESAERFVKYSYAFYWAMVTLFTTGYGDIHAHNIYEQWTCALCILVGSCFFGMIME